MKLVHYVTLTIGGLSFLGGALIYLWLSTWNMSAHVRIETAAAEQLIASNYISQDIKLTTTNTITEDYTLQPAAGSWSLSNTYNPQGAQIND